MNNKKEAIYRLLRSTIGFSSLSRLLPPELRSIVQGIGNTQDPGTRLPFEWFKIAVPVLLSPAEEKSDQ